jgi:Outer membrane protein beta-barrel domain
MKKIVFLAALVFIPALSFAQFNFGIKGGVNLSKFSFGDFATARLNANGSPAVSLNGQILRDNLSESLNSRTGSSFGVWARIGSNLFVQPEVMFSTRGNEFTIQRNDGGVISTQTVQITSTSFDVPVLIGLKGGPLRIMAGPMVSFQVANNQPFRDALNQYTAGTLNDAWAKAYYGYQIGGGLDLGRLGIDVRYEGSLSDVVSADLGTTGNVTALNQRIKSWQATLAYRIW